MTSWPSGSQAPNMRVTGEISLKVFAKLAKGALQNHRNHRRGKEWMNCGNMANKTREQSRLILTISNSQRAERKSVAKVAASIAKLEESTKFKSFKQFHIGLAGRFKMHRGKAHRPKTGKRLSIYARIVTRVGRIDTYVCVKLHFVRKSLSSCSSNWRA